jgi:hypothetical protein
LLACSNDKRTLVGEITRFGRNDWFIRSIDIEAADNRNKEMTAFIQQELEEQK